MALGASMFWSWLFGSSKTATKTSAAGMAAFGPPAASEPPQEVMPAGPFDATPPAPIGVPGPATPTADAGAAAAAGAAFLLGAEMALSGRTGTPAPSSAADQNGPGGNDASGPGHHGAPISPADASGQHHHPGPQASIPSDLGSIGSAPAGAPVWGPGSGSGDGGQGGIGSA